VLSLIGFVKAAGRIALFRTPVAKYQRPGLTFGGKSASYAARQNPSQRKPLVIPPAFPGQNIARGCSY
jgi:hypothetical protein